MICFSICYYKEVAIYVFDVQDVPQLPPGLYYTAGVDFENLAPHERLAGNVEMRGPFYDADFAVDCAVAEIDAVARRLDAEESNWAFVED